MCILRNHVFWVAETEMSYSLVKQSLQLLQDDLQPNDVSATSKKKKTKDAMKLIKTNRKGVWKELRRLQKQEQKKRRCKFQNPNFMSAVEKFQEDQKKKADDALPEVHQEEEDKAKKFSRKVLDYHLHFSKHRRKEEPEKKEEPTVFTDRDFDKFEEEYDFFDS